MPDPATRTPGPREAFRAMKLELGGLRRLAVLTTVFAGVAATAEVALVYSIALLASSLTSGDGGAPETGILSWIDLDPRELALGALGLVVVRGAFELLSIRSQLGLLRAYEVRRRQGILQQFISAEWAVQSEQESAEMLNALYNYLQTARNACKRVTDVGVMGISFLIMVAASIASGGLAALAIIGITGALAVSLRPLNAMAHRAAGRVRRANRDFAKILTEVVTRVRDIRLFDIGGPMGTRSTHGVDELAQAGYRAGLASGLLGSVYGNVIYLVGAAGLGILAVIGLDDPAPYAAVVLLLYRGLTYGRGMQSAYQDLVGSLPAIDALDERSRELESATVPSSGRPLGGPIETVAFRDVQYTYDNGHDALRGISLDIARGDALGVVGPTGSGKSTLIQLLLRLRLPTAGDVAINGISVRDLDPADYFGRAVLVAQEATLFRTTVFENVRLYRADIGDERVLEAMRDAHILDEMLALPDGLQTDVGEAGHRLSGGQRQRLCIARALAGSPEIIVLDEPTSALDMASEEAIRETLERVKGRATLIVVAHRLSTLRICDKVIVVRDGRLEATGTREDLEGGNEFFGEALRLSRLA